MKDDGLNAVLKGAQFLCSNVDLITHAVKLGTRSNWDHVAMVVKMKGRKNLRLFEATKVHVCD